MSLPQPYFCRDGCTLYHGDCREILPLLPKVDLVLTDPPYGIGAGEMNLGYSGSSRMESANWDDCTPDAETIQATINSGDLAIIWGGNYFGLPPSRGFIVWDKGPSFRDRCFSECEQAWCSWEMPSRIFTYDPMVDWRDKKAKQHKTQKPLNVMKWCIRLAGEIETILDPFAGSGTTLRAAMDLGRKAIGIEISEKYCEIAARRLEQRNLQFAEAL